MDTQALISIKNCTITDVKSKDIQYVSNINWTMNEGEQWIVTGSNGGGKSAFASAIGGTLNILPQNIDESSFYFNKFKDSTASVSFELAAKLIQEERENDEGEFIEGGIDIGRTPRNFIFEAMPKDGEYTKENLEKHPAIELLGIEKVLDRGLKYLSTGEIRRTLLAKALAAKPELLILDEPFEGLDVQSRNNLHKFLSSLMEQKTTHVLLVMDRFDYVPNSVTHVLEFSSGNVSFCGNVNDYKLLISERRKKEQENLEKNKENLKNAVKMAQNEGIIHRNTDFSELEKNNTPLIEMKNVNVGWDGKKVLDNVNWVVEQKQHWLIRGPNGSGKTTILELITGDNAQVFCNDISLFGKRRGSGETIWELKEKMGIVSYRLHVDYRNFGDMTIQDVVISGLHDSIGLYEQIGEYERILAKSWLNLCGFENRANEHFKKLSYGEQRAVLIARAAVKCPLLLILDEPCHGLDYSNKNRILSVLQTIAESGLTTILHVTHDKDEVLPCEKHILELHPEEKPMYEIIVQE